jgi:predicted glycosyltransferase
MGGYNTTMNILTTGVRSMILPFTGNGDHEQTIRAEKLE